MSYWLAKSDPDTYGWTDLVRDGKTTWDGIRNYKARNFLRAMQPGDIALFYHSGDEKSVVGAMKILSEPHNDDTSGEEIWSAVGAGTSSSWCSRATDSARRHRLFCRK